VASLGSEPADSHDTWRIRPVRPEDIPAIAALFDAADRADHLYKLSSEADIRETFDDPGPGSQTHAIVAEAPSQPGVGALLAAPTQMLSGVGRVSSAFRPSTGERIYSVLLRVHPSARPQALQHALAQELARMIRSAEADLADREDTPLAASVRIRTYVFDTQASAIEAWERLGLRRVRTGWTMARSLGEPIGVPPAPEGVTLRAYRRPEDNSNALAALNSAFADYYDSHPVSEAAWEREMAAPYTRPDLSWLALSGSGAAAGLAMCQVNDGENLQTGRLEGWIEGIGVVPPFRRRGIGKALLSRCLRSLRSAGLHTALADVDSESPPAVRLFQSAGFTVRSALHQYECLLDDLAP
jgi:mycothiol synthase